eukprot:tig00000325_g24083.t1
MSTSWGVAMARLILCLRRRAGVHVPPNTFLGTSWIRAATAIASSRRSQSCHSNGNFFIAGGQTGPSGARNGSTSIYVFKSEEVAADGTMGTVVDTGASLPGSITFAASAVAGNKLFCLGGLSNPNGNSNADMSTSLHVISFSVNPFKGKGATATVKSIALTEATGLSAAKRSQGVMTIIPQAQTSDYLLADLYVIGGSTDTGFGKPSPQFAKWSVKVFANDSKDAEVVFSSPAQPMGNGTAGLFNSNNTMFGPAFWSVKSTGKVYLYSGSNSILANGTFGVYDVATNSWSYKTSTASSPIFGNGATVVDPTGTNVVYVPGVGPAAGAFPSIYALKWGADGSLGWTAVTTTGETRADTVDRRVFFVAGWTSAIDGNIIIFGGERRTDTQNYRTIVTDGSAYAPALKEIWQATAFVEATELPSTATGGKFSLDTNTEYLITINGVPTKVKKLYNGGFVVTVFKAYSLWLVEDFPKFKEDFKNALASLGVQDLNQFNFETFDATGLSNPFARRHRRRAHQTATQIGIIVQILGDPATTSCGSFSSAITAASNRDTAACSGKAAGTAITGAAYTCPGLSGVTVQQAINTANSACKVSPVSVPIPVLSGAVSPASPLALVASAILALAALFLAL